MQKIQGPTKRTKLLKKFWDLKSADGELFRFLPRFAIDKKTGEVECENIIIKIGDKEHIFNYLNLYTFFYFISNEELRQNLIQRYERKITEVPYDVTFKLSEDEMKSGQAKRRITLPVDELAVYFAKGKEIRDKAEKELRKKITKKTDKKK